MQLPFPLLDAGVDEQGGQRLAVLAEDAAERLGSVALEDLGGVLAVERGALEAAGERAQDAVGADGGVASGGVGVERDDDPGAGQVAGLAEQGGLLAGQGGAAGGQAACWPGSARVTAMASNGPSARTGIAPRARAVRAWCRPNSRWLFL